MKYSMLALAFAAAGPAYAQQSDELCATLDNAITAAAETPTPFASLGPEGKAPLNAQGKVPSFFTIPNPPGLTDARTCRIDIAGTTYGSATGVARDKVECELFKVSEGEDKAGGAKAKAAAEAIATRLKNCLAPKGWTAAGPANQSGGRERSTVWAFAKPNSKVAIEARFDTFAFGRGKIVEDYKTLLNIWVEVPNKYVPKPPPPPPPPPG